MKWSLKIGRFSGIDVRMHITFLLLVGWVALLYGRQGQSVSAAVAGVAFILSVFLCVILHEFGHALAARRYGIKTRDIILLPIGGVARLEKMPTNPLHELWISIAGPAVNVVIAAILFMWIKVSASFDPFQVMTVTAGPFFERILVVNLFMIAFNMIPAFPMDGGRVLRAVLAMRSGHRRADTNCGLHRSGNRCFFWRDRPVLQSVLNDYCVFRLVRSVPRGECSSYAISR